MCMMGRTKRMPLLSVLVLAAGFASGSVSRAEEAFRSRAFGFGVSPASIGNNTIAVSAASLYSKKNGYGVLTKGCTECVSTISGQPASGDRPAGITRKGSIEFRVDVPAGAYAAEIVMNGGEKAMWRGAVFVNDSLVADSCVSFSMETEGDKPPAVWKIFTRATARHGSLVFKISAFDQPSTLASLHIFTDDIGPVEFAGGYYRPTRPLAAPNADLALRLINAGDVLEASRIVDAIPDAFRVEKAHLLFAMASLTNAQTPRALVEYGRALLAKEKNTCPSFRYDLSLHCAELYIMGDQFRKAAGWDWSSEINKTGIFVNTEIAGSAFAEIASVSNHPLWALGTVSAGKTAYWVWVEQHFPLQLVKAEHYLRQAARAFPDDRLLKSYLGEFPPGTGGESIPNDVPRWAFLQHSLSSRLLDIIHYWTEKRQAENGEFGGKYDDDCEMLRWWPFARVAVDDSTALRGMKRLVDGIWNSSFVFQGFSKKVRDVEHSSEPVADTQPMMIGFDYGNPVYVERCMQSVKLMRDLWTGITPLGHRHFRSSWYSSTALDTTAPRCCDVSMNTRTVKAVRWIAWYNRHPAAMNVLKEWSDAWLADCLRTDKGKPQGIVPAGIRFQDDAIGGFSDSWHHPGMFWPYYDFDGEADMLEQLLSAGVLFSDRKYYEPMESALGLITKYSGTETDKAPVGTEAWAAQTLQASSNFWEAAELWRAIAQKTTYDSLLMASGSAYMRFRLSGSDSTVLQELSSTVTKVENNYSLITSEGYFTDRIEVRDLREQKDKGASLLESMYLGSPLVDTFYPFTPISWKGFSADFSAFVVRTGAQGMAVRLYNHSHTEIGGSVILNQLVAGTYAFTQGPDANGDGRIDAARVTDTIVIDRHNATRALRLPPRREELLDVSLVSALPSSADGEAVCDLAIASAELQIDRSLPDSVAVTCLLHNIGVQTARSIGVVLERFDGGATVHAATVLVDRLDPPLDLSPKVAPVRFVVPRRSGTYRIRVSTSAHDDEITLSNNTIEFIL